MQLLPRGCFCALIPLAVFAQESVNYSSISGRVTDPNQSAVEGAQVTARETATNLGAAASTDREGRFRFPYLRVGHYEIKVEKPGFAEQIKQLTLTVGSAFELPISLSVSAAGSKVTVTADSVVLEAARSQIASTISQKEIQ